MWIPPQSHEKTDSIKLIPVSGTRLQHQMIRSADRPNDKVVYGTGCIMSLALVVVILRVFLNARVPVTIPHWDCKTEAGLRAPGPLRATVLRGSLWHKKMAILSDKSWARELKVGSVHLLLASNFKSPVSRHCLVTLHLQN